MIVIGIDPGKNTGIAVWDATHCQFGRVQVVGITEAQEIVHEVAFMYPGDVFLRIEDARLRKWFRDSGREKLQGAGSVKRDSAIWEEFCKYNKIPYQMVHPVRGGTKLSAKQFNQITGWAGRTNQNARDAAMLVFQFKSKMVEMEK